LRLSRNALQERERRELPVWACLMDKRKKVGWISTLQAVLFYQSELQFQLILVNLNKVEE